MNVLLLGRDLLFASRIESAAARADVRLARVDDPAELLPPDAVDLLLVDWGDRGAEWGSLIARWVSAAPEASRPRVVLFGPHIDLAAHADARSAGLGPMRARSWLLAQLPALLGQTAPV